MTRATREALVEVMGVFADQERKEAMSTATVEKAIQDVMLDWAEWELEQLFPEAIDPNYYTDRDDVPWNAITEEEVCYA